MALGDFPGDTASVSDFAPISISTTTGSTNFGGVGALLFVLILLAYVVLVLIAIYRLLKAKNDSGWKTNWLIVLIFVPLFGLIFWWMLGSPNRMV